MDSINKKKFEEFFMDNVDLRQMLKDFRGNYPESSKCDYCEKTFDELHPVSGDAWICIECYDKIHEEMKKIKDKDND